jgi:hypothetical protein
MIHGFFTYVFIRVIQSGWFTGLWMLALCIASWKMALFIGAVMTCSVAYTMVTDPRRGVVRK